MGGKRAFWRRKSKKKEKKTAGEAEGGEELSWVGVPSSLMGRLLQLDFQRSRKTGVRRGVSGVVRDLLEEGLREGEKESLRSLPPSHRDEAESGVVGPRWVYSEEGRGHFSVGYDEGMEGVWLEVLPQSAGDPVVSCEDLKVAVQTAAALLEELEPEEILRRAKAGVVEGDDVAFFGEEWNEDEEP